MTGHGAKFGRKRDDAIAALLSQRNIDEAPRQVGVASKTIIRWLQLPEFQTAYRTTRRDAFSQSVARLQQVSSAAVSTLLKVMVDPNSPAASRVRAADCVLGHAAKAIELEDIEVRVTELERPRKAQSRIGCNNERPMPNVRKRIEILERSFLPPQNLFSEIQSMEDVLPYISDDDLNFLLSASEAEGEGRVLTAREMQAQRAFARAVAQSRFT